MAAEPKPISAARYAQNAPSVLGWSISSEARRAAAAPSHVAPTAACAAGRRLRSAHPPSAVYVPPRPARVSATARPDAAERSRADATFVGITTPATPDSMRAALLTRPRFMSASAEALGDTVFFSSGQRDA